MTLASWYQENVIEAGDTRTKDMYFIDSPGTVTILLIVYYIFVRLLGPRWMKNRAAFKLRPLILAYNAAQVFTCLVELWIYGVDFAYKTNVFCTELITTDAAYDLHMTNAAWCYFMMKIIDLMDTFFFVLTKKQSHVSFLHVFHHISMVIASWLAAKYMPGGIFGYVAFANTIVHTFMYAYYFVTLYSGPVDIFWKKMMTIIQLAQFFTVVIIVTLNLLNPYCGFPKLVLMSLILHGCFFIYLFSMFYKNTYMRVKPPAAAAAVAAMKAKTEKTN